MRRVMYLWLPRWPIDRLSLSHRKGSGAPAEEIPFATVADAAVIIPTAHPDRITPHSEAFQAVVWHLIVSHPAMKAVQTKWESVR